MQVSQINNNQPYNSSFKALYLKSAEWNLPYLMKFERHPQVNQLIRLFSEWNMDLKATVTDKFTHEVELSAINNENIKDNNFVCKINNLSEFSAFKTFNNFMNKLQEKGIKCF